MNQFQRTLIRYCKERGKLVTLLFVSLFLGYCRDDVGDTFGFQELDIKYGYNFFFFLIGHYKSD